MVPGNTEVQVSHVQYPDTPVPSLRAPLLPIRDIDLAGVRTQPSQKCLPLGSTVPGLPSSLTYTCGEQTSSDSDSHSLLKIA